MEEMCLVFWNWNSPRCFSDIAVERVMLICHSVPRYFMFFQCSS